MDVSDIPAKRMTFRPNGELTDPRLRKAICLTALPVYSGTCVRTFDAAGVSEPWQSVFLEGPFVSVAFSEIEVDNPVWREHLATIPLPAPRHSGAS